MKHPQDLLCVLDHLARDFNPQAYGLPIYDNEPMAEMVKAVVAWTLTHGKDAAKEIITTQWEARIAAAHAENAALVQRIEVLQNELYSAEVLLKGDPVTGEIGYAELADRAIKAFYQASAAGVFSEQEIVQMVRLVNAIGDHDMDSIKEQMRAYGINIPSLDANLQN